MARVFLDTNWYFDIAKRDKEKVGLLKGHLVFISTLSTYILFYAFKLKVPNVEANQTQELLFPVALSKEILDRALDGPTTDLEDNIQLQSTTESSCDYFLTNDKNLLKMKFFGKAQILPALPAAGN
ncbi:MAG: hypothetical protein M1484_02535 [Patescibacteria group bacterium]|nr:hypothetical protein [Patescibacteria group bacterium]MCL5431958.1 hypothetical protein [Patescibacteria group bacterium]